MFTARDVSSSLDLKAPLFMDRQTPNKVLKLDRTTIKVPPWRLQK